jgi:16S rRNA (cytosine1407-C5)-methyltransferase
MKKRKKYVPKLSPDLPELFVAKLKELFSEADFQLIMSGFSKNRKTSLRINTLKTDPEKIRTELETLGISYEESPLSDLALVLPESTSREVTELRMYQEQEIYLQNLSSMLPPLVLAPEPGEKILDMTAAPGSKTTQMAAMMAKQGQLVAFELNFVRFKRLEANVAQQVGDDFVEVRHEPGENAGFKFANHFDKVLLDAPCSSEGQFSLTNPKSYAYWNRHKVKEMVYKQSKLINAAFHALKPGGLLLYSTCTFAPEENEQIVDKILKKHPEELEILDIELPFQPDNLRPGFTSYNNRNFHPDLAKTIRVLPDQQFEGFYLALLRKK